jgi:hypothetical protein
MRAAGFKSAPIARNIAPWLASWPVRQQGLLADL